MNKEDIKVSQLSSDSYVANNDLLLKIRESQTTPYSMSHVRVREFTDSVFDRDKDISADWNLRQFPTIDNRINIENFTSNLDNNLSGLSNSFNEGEILSDIEEEGNNLLDLDSVSAQQQPATIEFINQIASYIYYKTVTAIDSLDMNFMPSEVGDVIFATTLNPISSFNGVLESESGAGDAKVRKLFGYGRKITDFLSEPDTHWKLSAVNCLIQGCNEDEGNVIGETTGSDTIDLDSTQHVPRHNHQVASSHTHSMSTSQSLRETAVTSFYTYRKRLDNDFSSYDGVNHWVATYGDPTRRNQIGGRVSGSVSVNKGTYSKEQTSSTDGDYDNYTLDIKQAYKNVYVWVRTK